MRKPRPTTCWATLPQRHLLSVRLALPTKSPSLLSQPSRCLMCLARPSMTLTPKNLNTSNQIIQSVLTNSSHLLPGSPLLYVDVRDVAATHITAMTNAGLTTSAASVPPVLPTTSCCSILCARCDPSNTEGLTNVGVPEILAANFVKFDNSESQKYLQLKYKTLEETVADTADRLKELAKESN